MGCVEEYSRNCLNAKDRRLVEDQVAGANYTFHFLCDDKTFQKEYLKYTSCYRGITHQWDTCANRFMELVREEMARRNATEHQRMLELCCAKYGFLRCVYVASLHICRKEEAIFLNRIAETLSAIRVYTPICRDVDYQVCGAAPPPGALAAPPLLLQLLAVAVAVAAGALLSRPMGDARRC
ncbi:hypothetical protein R5R35_014582 [Gryllus longicercus]|uniref:Uncharacterized protein n=1 Tax=Gryllus longicercus TaxID=2509291 RepID=A0AAN9VBD5_9ORTH